MSSKETLTVAPTRMNLLDLRNRKKLAENGYNLLKENKTEYLPNILDLNSTATEIVIEEEFISANLTILDCSTDEYKA